MSFNHSNSPNVGIIDFFTGKTIFITGSTGFIGKVFVEKLLRAVPLIQRIYLLVRASNEDVAMQRLRKEIIDSKLFKILREKHGNSYEKFMLNKVVPLAGDLCKPIMGMDINIAGVIKNEIDVIVHTGGNAKWHDRHDKSLEVNVSAISRVINFAMNCTNLILFMHVSSVYVNQNKPGLEKCINLGENRREDGKALSIEQLIDDEMKIASEVAKCFDQQDLALEMLKLGMRRSKLYNLQNNYLLTKSMGEMIASKPIDKFPVVIIRPSLVHGTFIEPFPGWVQGYKVLDPLILSYGKGEIKGVLANPCTIIDVVPVDMVVNAMITAIAKHGIERKKGVNIYNVSSSQINPLSCYNLFKFCTDFFKSNPLKDINGNSIIVKDINFFESMAEFILVGLRDFERASNTRVQRKVLRMAAIYEQVLSTIGLRFDDKNTRKLLEEMSLKELKMFNFDFKCIDWENYLINTHIPGLALHVVEQKVLSPKL